jgi:L-serine deaminase
MNGFNLTAVLQVITTLVIGIIGFFIKRELTKLEQADEENKNKIISIEKDLNSKIEKVSKENALSNSEILEQLNDFKGNVSKEYVRKEDSLQTTSEIMKRLEKIYDMLYEMRGSIRGGSKNG